MIGLRYAALMEDFDKIQEEILNCDINSNKEATKIYSMPNRLGLPNATLLKNKIASKYGMLYTVCNFITFQRQELSNDTNIMG